MNILIGADIVPTSTNSYLFTSCNVKELVGDELLDILQKADYRIFNLEIPITDVVTPIQKCGPNLIAPTKSINGIKKLGIDFLTLANNHILDHGEQGLHSTIKLLEQHEIAYGGIGNNAEEAAKPYVAVVNDKRIGIYCCAEHEFSIASDTNCGANPFDPLESLDHIVKIGRAHV